MRAVVSAVYPPLAPPFCPAALRPSGRMPDLGHRVGPCGAPRGLGLGVRLDHSASSWHRDAEAPVVTESGVGAGLHGHVAARSGGGTTVLCLQSTFMPQAGHVLCAGRARKKNENKECGLCGRTLKKRDVGPKDGQRVHPCTGKGSKEAPTNTTGIDASTAYLVHCGS